MDQAKRKGAEEGVGLADAKGLLFSCVFRYRILHKVTTFCVYKSRLQYSLRVINSELISTIHGLLQRAEASGIFIVSGWLLCYQCCFWWHLDPCSNLESRYADAEQVGNLSYASCNPFNSNLQATTLLSPVL